VTAETSHTFLQELLHTDLETLQHTYTKDHLLVLTDVAWTDYETVFSRTLFLCAQPKLLLQLASSKDADLLPLLNLVRANDRLPTLFDTSHIEVAARGHVLVSKEKPSRTYAAPVFDPYDPYPIYLEETTSAFTKLLFPVKSVWETISTTFNYNGAVLFVCSSEKKKKDVERFFRCNGFVAKGDGFARNDTFVYIFSCFAPFKKVAVGMVHFVDPPEKIACCVAQAQGATTLYLYVPYATPFDEPSELRAYRMMLGNYVKQEWWLHDLDRKFSVTEILVGLFVHNPLWTRGALFGMAQNISSGISWKTLQEEMQRIVETHHTVVDMFERPGHIVFSDNMYIYQPNFNGSETSVM
jgi:hypothetical protein